MTQRRIRLPFGAAIVIETDDEQAMALLAARVDRLTQIGPLLERWAKIMRDAYGDRFKQGGDPAWKPLAASTVASKSGAGLPARTPKGRVPWRLKQQGQFGPANILIRSGALRDSYRRKGARGHVEQIDAGAGTVSVGSNLPYAKFHQAGTRAYVIRPVKSKALAFMGADGMIHIARSVHHPGLTARPVTITPDDIQQMRTAALDFVGGSQEAPDAA